MRFGFIIVHSIITTSLRLRTYSSHHTIENFTTAVCTHTPTPHPQVQYPGTRARVQLPGTQHDDPIRRRHYVVVVYPYCDETCQIKARNTNTVPVTASCTFSPAPIQCSTIADTATVTSTEKETQQTASKRKMPTRSATGFSRRFATRHHEALDDGDR